MNGKEFFETGMGRKFHDSDVPRLVEALERIAEAMEKANVLKERELKVEATTPAQVAQEFIVGGLKMGKLNPRIDTACHELITQHSTLKGKPT